MIENQPIKACVVPPAAAGHVPHAEWQALSVKSFHVPDEFRIGSVARIGTRDNIAELLQLAANALVSAEQGMIELPRERLGPLTALTEALVRAADTSPRAARDMTWELSKHVQQELALLWAYVPGEILLRRLGGWTFPFVIACLQERHPQSGSIQSLIDRLQVSSGLNQEWLLGSSPSFVRDCVSSPVDSERTVRNAELIASISHRCELRGFPTAEALEVWRRPASRRHGAPALQEQLKNAASLEVVSGGGLQSDLTYRGTLAGSATELLAKRADTRITGRVRLDGPVGIVLSVYGIPLAVASLFAESDSTVSLIQLQRCCHASANICLEPEQIDPKRLAVAQRSSHLIPLLGSIYWQSFLLDASLHFAAVEQFSVLRVPAATRDNLRRFAGRGFDVRVLEELAMSAAQHGAFSASDKSRLSSWVAAPRFWSRWNFGDLGS